MWCWVVYRFRVAVLGFGAPSVGIELGWVVRCRHLVFRLQVSVWGLFRLVLHGFCVGFTLGV